MKTFLEYVAHDIIAKHGGNLSKMAIVFPNKRAALFMNGHLYQASGKTMWGPSYMTISELISRHSKAQLADQILLVCELYKSFTQCTGIDETLDHFYGWGELLLSDFDDIDKNLADASQVFRNLKDIHAFDDVSYLTEVQKEALKRLFKDFSDDQESKLKQKFLSLWSHFGDIYTDFNRRLSEQGIAYEGALYRSVAEDENVDFAFEKYIFVGFNVLQKAEQKIFSRLKDEGKAEFYWNFDKYYMSGNEAGNFIRQYLEEYPNELGTDTDEIYDNLSRPKHITYISATTETVQARYVASWLRDKNRIKDGERTAIVLCDESLLQTVIHCLPPELKDVNITTGYPLSQTPFASLIDMLIRLQTLGHPANTDKYRLHYIRQVLRHPYAHYISENGEELVNGLQSNFRYYPSRSELSRDEALALLFSDIESGPDDPNKQILSWLLGVLKLIARNATPNGDEMFNESLFRTYTLLNRLYQLVGSGTLAVDKITMQRLIRQLVQSTSIPFHGEPVVGVQIMGVLETRNLDFDHVLLLSCNEGNMPKGVNDSSFIPYSIRKAFGLTTIDNKVAIYSYYFHSLLQRASDITIAYNNSTEDGHTGEMSRFMLQLMTERNDSISLCSLEPQKALQTKIPQPVDKGSENVAGVLASMKNISPSAINRYIRCQLIFYYNDILGIKEPDETDEEMLDNRTFGNIFHKAAQLVYNELKNRDGIVDEGAINLLLKDKRRLEAHVDRAFREELFKVKNADFHPQYNGIQLINRSVIKTYLKRLLEIDKKLTPIKIIGLETEVDHYFEFKMGSATRRIKVYGYIDRLDEVSQDGQRRIRVVDYKTGRKPKSTPADIEEIFMGLRLHETHSDYYLQTILYSLLVADDKALNPNGREVAPALLFIQQTHADNYDPTLVLGKEKMTDIEKYRTDYDDGLGRILGEMLDVSTRFVPVNDKNICRTCPYRQLCWK